MRKDDPLQTSGVSATSGLMEADMLRGLLGLFGKSTGVKHPDSKADSSQSLERTRRDEIPRSATEIEDIEAVDEAERLIKALQKGRALALLLDVVLKKPDTYPYQFSASGKTVVRCWHAMEFMRLCAERKGSEAMVWFGNAYGRAAYYLGGLLVEMHLYEEAIVNLNIGLSLEPGNPLIIHEKAQALM